jgi:hypothetical protein
MFLHPFRLFSMFGFEVRIDASWLLLAVLISLDARRRFLPQRHPRADNGDLLVEKGSPCDHRLALLNRISRDGTFARRPPLRHADPRHHAVHLWRRRGDDSRTQPTARRATDGSRPPACCWRSYCSALFSGAVSWDDPASIAGVVWYLAMFN